MQGQAGVRKKVQGKKSACLTFSLLGYESSLCIIPGECQFEYSTWVCSWHLLLPADEKIWKTNALKNTALKSQSLKGLGAKPHLLQLHLFGQLEVSSGSWASLQEDPMAAETFYFFHFSENWHFEPESGILINSAYRMEIRMTWNLQTQFGTVVIPVFFSANSFRAQENLEDGMGYF